MGRHGRQLAMLSVPWYRVHKLNTAATHRAQCYMISLRNTLVKRMSVNHRCEFSTSMTDHSGLPIRIIYTTRHSMTIRVCSHSIHIYSMGYIGHSHLYTAPNWAFTFDGFAFPPFPAVIQYLSVAPMYGSGVCDSSPAPPAVHSHSCFF